jgi:hypothetical protein
MIGMRRRTKDNDNDSNDDKEVDGKMQTALDGDTNTMRITIKMIIISKL